jgi:hypothetical protein
VHVASESPILFFGTPVVPDQHRQRGRHLQPRSDVLGHELEVVAGVELPGPTRPARWTRIARTTASDPIPEGKQMRGYRTLRERFARAGLTPVGSQIVAAPRAAECPVQMEARVLEPARSPPTRRCPPGSPRRSR